MKFNIFSLFLWLEVLVNVSSSWSSIINSILNPKTIMQYNQALNPVIIETVALGAQLAIDECKNIFKWDRWNCPQSAFSRQTKQLATKEKAYTDAIIVAGIIYSITRACSQGIIKGCGCDPNLKENNFFKSPPQDLQIEKDWSWGGCSDDASFGENLVLKLLEENQSNDPITKHNNRIGREIIREKMLKTCKCHGVSGSCSFQTCWMQMPTFSEIARQLKERYDNAIMISFEKIDGAVSLGNTARQPNEADFPKTNLLYLEKSPDFCLSNNSTGWPGTKGRICSRANPAPIKEKKSCRNLCRSCGYKIKKQKKKINRRCNCKFIWCCEVECNNCIQTVEEFYCV